MMMLLLRRVSVGLVSAAALSAYFLTPHHSCIRVVANVLSNSIKNDKAVCLYHDSVYIGKKTKNIHVKYERNTFSLSRRSIA